MRTHGICRKQFYSNDVFLTKVSQDDEAFTVNIAYQTFAEKRNVFYVNIKTKTGRQVSVTKTFVNNEYSSFNLN